MYRIAAHDVAPGGACFGFSWVHKQLSISTRYDPGSPAAAPFAAFFEIGRAFPRKGKGIYSPTPGFSPLRAVAMPERAMRATSKRIRSVLADPCGLPLAGAAGRGETAMPVAMLSGPHFSGIGKGTRSRSRRGRNESGGCAKIGCFIGRYSPPSVSASGLRGMLPAIVSRTGCDHVPGRGVAGGGHRRFSGRVGL